MKKEKFLGHQGGYRIWVLFPASKLAKGVGLEIWLSG